MNSWKLLLMLVCLIDSGLVCADSVSNRGIIVGSKNFTESVVLAEIVRLEAQQLQLKIEHRRALGGTAILWQALLQNQIDIYPEYTGTLIQELLHDLPPRADIETLRQRLATRGIGMSEPLGFEDGYALAINGETADRLKLRDLSDLGTHTELRYGLSNEFIDRADGWPGLRTVYALAPTSLRGLDHDLAYRALHDRAVDVVDAYTTDAEIAEDHLRVLNDDRRYFPRYDSVLLYRLDSATREPALAATITQLAQRISVEDMRQMNAEVKLQHHDESEVAAEFLGQAEPVEPHTKITSLILRIGQRTLEHLSLVGISLGLALLIGLPLGIVAAGHPAMAQSILAFTSILQTVPSLAMLVFLIPILGIGTKPAIAALFFYSLLPIVRNTIVGLIGIDPNLRDSARVLGLPRQIRLLRIELPLAQQAIFAGVSTAAVINVGTATLGALIGAGGYGQPILTGVRLGNIGLILEGAIPAAVLALLVQAGFQQISTLLTPRHQRSTHVHRANRV